MKKNALAAAIALTLCLSACGSAAVSDDVSSEDEQIVVSEVSSAEESSAADDSETVSEDESSSENEESSASESEGDVEYAEFKPVDGVGTKYADLDNRCFAYDGKIYKLGEVTLSDLIDAGLPFDDSDVKHSDDDLEGNYETNAYNVSVNEYTFLQLVFMNTTDDTIKEKDGLLYSVRWCTLYVPNDDYDKNLRNSVIESINDCAQHVGFAFPLNLMKEDLIENSPEDADVDEFGHVNYKVKSEKYMGSSGYDFSFDNTTNQLKDVTITYLP